MSISNGFRLSSLEFTVGHGKQKGKSGICNLSAFFLQIASKQSLGCLWYGFNVFLKDCTLDGFAGWQIPASFTLLKTTLELYEIKPRQNYQELQATDPHPTIKGKLELYF